MTKTLKVKRRKLADLLEDPENAQHHPPSQIRALRKALERFGQQIPLVVNDKGVVIAGNGRLKAMELLGWDECDVVETELDEDTQRAFAIADNKLAQLSESDGKVVADQLRLLADTGGEVVYDLGFDEAELLELGAIMNESPGDPEPGEPNPNDPAGGAGGLDDGGDPTSGDPPPTGRASYNVVFDDVVQQERFFAFVRWLRTEVPGETIGERLMTWLDKVWKE